MNFGGQRIGRLAAVVGLVISLNGLPVRTIAEAKEMPQVSRSLSDLRVRGTKYLFKDCNAVDWCWQPKGTYTNASRTGTITYLEVVYTISARGESVKFMESLRTRLRPGKSVGILSGRNFHSFRLSFYDSAAATIGPLLGSSYVSWTWDVRYLKFSDGSSVGQKVNS